MKNTKNKKGKSNKIKVYFGLLLMFYLWLEYKQNRQITSEHDLRLMAIDGLAVVAVFVLINLAYKCIKRKIRHKKYLASGIREIDRMSGLEFELVCANHLRKLGYKVEETKASCDMGADLIIKKGSEKIAVQCKRYNSKLSNTCVQEVVASMPIYGATSCMVITNNFFTKNCREVALANGCVLWDRNDIIDKFKIHE